jgi:hypothetical protein
VQETVTQLGELDAEVGRGPQRTLLELLSGRMSQEEFFKHYSFIPDENPFRQALDGGQLVTSLERSEEEDDDWIFFEMKGPDPAIGPFLMSDSSDQKKETKLKVVHRPSGRLWGLEGTFPGRVT